MPFYLWQASYTLEGVKGLRKDGGSKRKAMVQQMVEKAGGTLHSFYFAFGDSDVLGIAEFPDHATAIGLSMVVNASGAVNFKTMVLATPEEVDAAAKKSIAYSPPGA